MDVFAPRRDRVLQFLLGAGVDGAVVTHPVNVTYLTGFSGEASYLLIGRDKTILVSDGRFTTQIQEECPGLDAHIRPPSLRITPAAAQVLEALKWPKVALDAGHVTLAEFEQFRALCPAVQWQAGTGLVERFRVVKDASEIAAIRAATAIAERALRDFLPTLDDHDTEKQLHDRMEMLLRAEGAKAGCFPPIIGIDTRAALPHAVPTAKTLAGAHLLLVDWGARDQFYISDVTRTFACGAVTPKFEEIYRTVLQAQRAAIELLRPGAVAQDIDTAVRQVFEAAGYLQYFNHGLGHGIGLEVHEAPALRPGSDTKLEAGMVVTIEPGLYLPEWGGVRIEDDVLITEEGHEVLTAGIGKDLDQVLLQW
jgi:Xaa-Pro aminopeptidase